jgi:hypothetical protein
MSADGDGPGAGPVNGALLNVIEPYIDVLADKIAVRLEGRRGRMINQHESELGPRRHREAVKRRIERGEGGAGRAGRNYLLTREAVREELARPGGRGKGGKGAGPSAGAPVPAGGGGDNSPSSGAASGAKTRTRDQRDWERELMSGLRAVEER